MLAASEKEEQKRKGDERKQMEMIDVLLVKPGKHPALVNIPYSLESLQGMVGGWIQEICPFDDPVALIVNDDGKMFLNFFLIAVILIGEYKYIIGF